MTRIADDTCLLITTCNRTPLLERSLHHLFAFGNYYTLPQEVLVVDDGGDDGCLQSLGTLPRVDGVSVRYIYTHNPGKALCAHARNVGITHTEKKYIVQTEPEVMWRTDVITQMFDEKWNGHQFESIHAGIVLNHRMDGSYDIPHVHWLATYAVLFERDWLLAIGGWDESFPDPWGWDDVDLETRLRISGHGQHILDSIVVEHQWHKSGLMDQERNEAYFRSKAHHDDETNHSDLIANTTDGIHMDPTWGVIKERT